MLSHPTLEQLNHLGLAGMAEAFAEIEASSEVGRLTHPEWLGLLIDREVTHHAADTPQTRIEILTRQAPSDRKIKGQQRSLKRATSSRNPGRLDLAMAGRLRRNTQPARDW